MKDKNFVIICLSSVLLLFLSQCTITSFNSCQEQGEVFCDDGKAYMCNQTIYGTGFYLTRMLEYDDKYCIEVVDEEETVNSEEVEDLDLEDDGSEEEEEGSFELEEDGEVEEEDAGVDDAEIEDIETETKLPIEKAGVILEHGRYSTSYESDWAALGTGKYIADIDADSISFTPVVGEDVRQTFVDQDEVYISNIAYEVAWDAAEASKYSTTLFYVKNAEFVLIEDVAVKQMDSDYSAYNTIFIDGCGTAIIRNSYFAGPVKHTQIRVEGCEYVLVENNEIEGVYFDGYGYLNGYGILIKNEGTETSEDGTVIQPELARVPQWFVVQNNYVHDYLLNSGDVVTGAAENQDGIGVASAGDGILFNNYIENWKASDAGIDVGHRIYDNELYKDKAMRVERNFVKNSNLVKTTGPGDGTNAVVWANNIFINTFVADYHQNYPVYHKDETVVFDADYTAKVFFKLWGPKTDGKIYLDSNVVYAAEDDSFNVVYYQSGNAEEDNYLTVMESNQMAYIVSGSFYWLAGGSGMPVVSSWDDWTELQDTNSEYDDGSACSLTSDFALDCQEDGSAMWEGTSSELSEYSWLDVPQDFYGMERTDKTPGAVLKG